LIRNILLDFETILIFLCYSTKESLRNLELEEFGE
jgi:hypothetical protein